MYKQVLFLEKLLSLTSIWHLIFLVRQMLKVHYPASLLTCTSIFLPSLVRVITGLGMAKSPSRWISVLVQCLGRTLRLVPECVLNYTVGNSYRLVQKCAIWNSYALRYIMFSTDSLPFFLPKRGDDSSMFLMPFSFPPFPATRTDNGWKVDLHFMCKLKTTKTITLSNEPG